MPLEIAEKFSASNFDEIPNSADDLDDLEWAERSDFWIGEMAWKKGRYPEKKRPRRPLILAGHGVRMNIDNGALVVRNGRTHHPQIPDEWRIFRGDRFLPSRIVMLDGDGHLTFDVLAWLAEQNVPLIQIDWMGTVVTVVGGTGYGANHDFAAAQTAIRSGKMAFKIAAELVCRKLEVCAANITDMEPTDERQEAISFLRGEIRRLEKKTPKAVSEILGIEGRAAAVYFAAWGGIPLKWKGIGSRPVPADWHQVGSRVSPIADRNRHAIHPVNAMLNYGYAMLENQVRIAIISAGLDPTIGCLHSGHRGQHALVFDLMEPLRPIVDRLVLDLVRRCTFSFGDFTLAGEGVCRLNPQFARVVVKQMDLGGEAKTMVDLFVGSLRG